MRFTSLKSFLTFTWVLATLGYKHPFNSKDWKDFFNNYCGLYISLLNFKLVDCTNDKLILDINNKYKNLARVEFVKFINEDKRQ